MDEIDTKSTLVVQGLLKPVVSTLANLAKRMNTKNSFMRLIDGVTLKCLSRVVRNFTLSLASRNIFDNSETCNRQDSSK